MKNMRGFSVLLWLVVMTGLLRAAGRPDEAVEEGIMRLREME